MSKICYIVNEEKRSLDIARKRSVFVAGDKFVNSVEIWFPEGFEDMNLDTSLVRVMYKTPAESEVQRAALTSFYNVDDVYRAYTWNLNTLTNVPGNVSFAICLLDLASDGQTVEYEWHTTPVTFNIVSTIHGETDAVVPPDVEAAIETQIQALRAEVSSLTHKINNVNGGLPTPVSLASEMVDISRLYLYTGSETGMQHGYWYYYDRENFEWTAGAQYGAHDSDSVLDETSTNPIQNKAVKVAFDQLAADAKKNGDEISELKEDLNAVSDSIPEYLKASDVTGTHQWYGDANGTLVTGTSIDACTFGTAIPIEAGKTYYYKDIIGSKSWYKYTASGTSGRIKNVVDNNLYSGTFTATADGTVICSGYTANASTAIWTADESIYNAGLQQDKIILKTDSTLTDDELPANAKATGYRIGLIESELESMGDVAETVKAVSDVTEKVEPINLIDVSKVTTGYLGQNCNLQTNAGKITEFIKVKPNTEYTCNNLSTGTSAWVSWMFESDTLASKIGIIQSTTFTTPSNCNYVRLVYMSQANAESAMLVEGDTLPSSYVPYHDPYYVLSADGLKPALDYTDEEIDKVIDVGNNSYFDSTFGKCNVNSTYHTVTN